MEEEEKEEEEMEEEEEEKRRGEEKKNPAGAASVPGPGPHRSLLCCHCTLCLQLCQLCDQAECRFHAECCREQESLVDVEV